MNGADLEAVYNPATGDYSVPSGGGGINVGVGALTPLPTLSGSYAADGTGSASSDILQWINTLGGIGASFYRASTGAPAIASSVPGAARTPTAANTTATAQAGTGTIIVVLFVALLVFLGVRKRR